MTADPKPLTPAQVKAEFGIGHSQLNQLVRDGRIKTVHGPGFPRLYWRKDIEEYLATRDPRGRKHPEPVGLIEIECEEKHPDPVEEAEDE